MKSLYAFNDYRSYIQAANNTKNPNRGGKTKLARVMELQPAYLTLVFQNRAHLSLEQAEPLNSYFGHGEQESKYFLLLVQRGRAGTDSLRRFFDRELQLLRREQQSLSRRIESKSEVGDADQQTYYSSWIYPAVHIATFLQEGKSQDSLAKMLRVPMETIANVVRFLLKSGLIEKQGLDLKPTQRFVHLPKSSPLIGPHHTNWRTKSIQQLQEDPRKGLFYSGVLSVSEADYVEMIEKQMSQIQQLLKMVENSKDERLIHFSLDFFSLA